MLTNISYDYLEYLVIGVKKKKNFIRNTKHLIN